MDTLSEITLKVVLHTPVSTLRLVNAEHRTYQHTDPKSMKASDVREEAKSATQNSHTTPEDQAAPDRSEDTEQVVFEPLGNNPYDLSYTCLVIPRFSSHYLMGELAARLPEWMQQICVSFGWRLEYIAVKSDYLQWTIGVPPATSTSYFMKAIRRQTSLFIFEEFPRIKRENLSGDFWAPGYLIYFGSRPHPPDVIRDFIRQTRQQQGHPPHG